MLARVSFWAPEGSQTIKAECDNEADDRVSITVGSDVHLLLSLEEARTLKRELSRVLLDAAINSTPVQS